MKAETPVRDRDPGLARAFGIGEIVPWKGLVFEVEFVEYDRLTLKAVGVTMKNAKKGEWHE